MNAAPRPLGRLDRGDAIVLLTAAGLGGRRPSVGGTVSVDLPFRIRLAPPPPAPLTRLDVVVLGATVAGVCVVVLLALGRLP